MNYREFGDRVRYVWTSGERSKPGQTLALLKLESNVGLRDSRFAELQGRVLDTSSWLDLMSGIGGDESIARALDTLHAWIIAASDWSAESKFRSHETFRDAVLQFIGDEDEVWTCSMTSLRCLAEATTRWGLPLRQAERAALTGAAKLVVKTIVDNVDDAEVVTSEAEELTALQGLCGANLTAEIATLNAFADRLAERGNSETPSKPEAQRFKSDDSDAELDIDSLFAGLLDR